MELYINNSWTKSYGKHYLAEAITWSENGNHATIYTTGATAQEADAKLRGALCELRLIPGKVPTPSSQTGPPAPPHS